MRHSWPHHASEAYRWGVFGVLCSLSKQLDAALGSKEAGVGMGGMMAVRKAAEGRGG